MSDASPELERQRQWMREVLITRRTVHDYAPDPIPEPLLESALQTALAAPNHRMTEPWRFVLVGEQARRALVDIALELKRKKGLTPKGESEVRSKMLNPPHLVVVCRRRHEKPDVEREDYAAVACAVQNFMLHLWMYGVGSKWSTGGVTTAPATYALLDVPKDEEIQGFVWVGKARTDVAKPRRKHGLDEVLRRVP
jgi:nitroreductase